ncbi:MAG TPA: methylisocitrate lyase [Pirellulaceae bacterium]|nr:methylisocitrate lyase [Pirellulaceae bacterium]
MTSPGKALRDAIEDSTIQVIGAPNALAARLIEEAGFDAAYLSGAAFSAGALALPDIGLFTLSELTQQATWITRSTRLPLIVDADTGFGDALNVERTIVELESADVAAVQLEDQQLPKRCGHLSGKTLVEPEVMCAKLRAACEARGDPDLVLIARTDARGVTSLEDAVERAKRYVDAGADWIFPEALTTKEEFERFAREIDAPLVANMTEFGKSPLLSLAELADLGYSAVLYPVTLLRVAMKAMQCALDVIADEGTQQNILDLMQTRDELYELLDYRGYEERHRAHFGGPPERFDSPPT